MSAVTETEKNINTEKKTTNRFVEVAKSLMKNRLSLIGIIIIT